MSSSRTARTSTTGSSTSSPSDGVDLIACGALAQPAAEIAARHGWPLTVHPLPPLLHNQPHLIAGEVRPLAEPDDAPAPGPRDLGEMLDLLGARRTDRLQALVERIAADDGRQQVRMTRRATREVLEAGFTVDEHVPVRPREPVQVRPDDSVDEAVAPGAFRVPHRQHVVAVRLRTAGEVRPFACGRCS